MQTYLLFIFKEITLWRKGDRIRKSLQMAPAPVTTPTSNGDSDQVQAFEKVVTPISEEAPLSTEEAAADAAASNGKEEEA